MLAEPSGRTVRRNDQRQFCPRDRTILHADEAIVDARPLIAEVHMFRLSLAGGAKQQGMTMQAQNALRSVANMTVKIRQFASSANSLGIA